MSIIIEHIQNRITIYRDEHDNYVITYNLKQGIDKFGDKGVQSAKSEVGQLHSRNCFEPIHVHTLTPLERRKVLESLIFLTEKWDGQIKARMCANGSKQRDWMQKEESSSPTTSIEALFLQSTINAHKKRHNITLNIPNAFIQMDHEGQTVHMKIRG